MSNPGVLTLSELKIGGHKAFRVEDNLGESVHLHYRDVRIDLTMEELLYLGEKADEVLLDRVKAEGFQVDLLKDEAFLFASEYLVDLEKISEESIPLKELYGIKKNRLGLPVWKPVSKLPVPKKGKEEQILLFNQQPLIRFGAGRAAKLYAEDPSRNVKVLRLRFKEERHSMDEKPWKKCLYDKTLGRVARFFRRKKK